MIPRSLASPCPHCPLAAESSRGVVGRKKRRLTGNWALCDRLCTAICWPCQPEWAPLPWVPGPWPQALASNQQQTLRT